MLALIPIGIVAVRFLGYGNLIAQSRKEKLISHLATLSDVQLRKTEEWIEKNSGSFEEVCQSLVNEAVNFSWASCSVFYEDKEIHAWSSLSDAQLHGVVHQSYELGAGYRLDIQQLTERQSFVPFERAQQKIVMMHLRSVLATSVSVSRSVSH